jgi:opacity protein-like surface antigen
MYTRTTTPAFAAILTIAVSTPAFAGGLSEIIVETAPAPVAEAPVVATTDWSGFYVGGSIGSGTATLIREQLEADGNVEDSYAIHAGYMHDFGAFILGAEGEYGQLVVNPDDDDPEDATVLRAKLRAGYDMGRIMPYVVGGYAVLDLTESDGDPFTGTFFGAGAEFAVTDNFLVGGEFLRHDLTDDALDLEVSTVAIRLSYRF